MRDQLPPNCIDAERATVGAMLLDNTIITRIEAILSPGDFYNPHCRRMYREIVAMREQGEPAEAATLGMRLGDDYTLHIGQALESVGHAGNADYYAGKVREMAERRRVIEDCKNQIAAALDIQKPLPSQESEPAKEPPAQYKPFPVEALPEAARGFITAGSKAIGCDLAFIALPLLSVLGAAIGNSRRLRVKCTWHAPAIVWAAIVGESGTAKSPAFKLALKALREIQRQAMREHETAQTEYGKAMLLHEKRMAEWKRDKKTLDDPPMPPDPPTPKRYIVSDTTVEGLAPILRDNPRGLLLERDELAGWLGSFDRYAKSNSGDSANWLSMFDGESLTVDRKTGQPRTIYVPSAAVCVTGGIQPVILNRVLGTEHRESGLAARLLLASPPRRPKKWTEAELHESVENAIADVIGRLLSLEMAEDGDGNPRPALVGMSNDAKAAFIAYYNAHNQEQMDLTGELSAAWSKLEGYAARLALLIHLVRWAANDPALTDADTLDLASMNAAITLATWFKGEALRVYAILGESEADREQRRLVEWIANRGGEVTARDVQMGCRWLRESGAAEAALTELVSAGLGHWQDAPRTEKGGRPTRVFHLSTSTKPLKTRDSQSFVDVDDIDTPEVETKADDGEWGEI